MTQKAKTETPWKTLMGSNDLRRDLREIYDRAFLGELAGIVGTSSANPNLVTGVEKSVRAYLLARRDMMHRKPGKLETRRIEPVADAAHRLFLALSNLNDKPNPQLKIISALDAAIADNRGRGADLLTLAHERHGPGDPLRALTELSALLASSSAQLVGKSPGDASDDRRERGAKILETELVAWKSRKHKTETQPVLALVKAFRPTWKICTTSAYSEGMYRKPERRNVSPAVDAVLLIGRRIDPKLSRARVVTAFRSLPAG